MDNESFLRVTYKLMIKRVERLMEIDTKMKRGKLPLPLLKEKLEITSNMIEALRQLVGALDYENEVGVWLADVYNDISIKLSLGTIDHDTNAYEDIIIILKQLRGPDED